MSTKAQEQNLCPTCGQQIPEDPALVADEPPELVRQVAETPHDVSSSFESLTLGLPKSVLCKITAKLDRVGIEHLDTPEVRAVLDAARASYETKKERARVASAKRRAAAKSPAEPEPEPEPPL